MAFFHFYNSRNIYYYVIRRYLTQWQRFENSSNHSILRYPLKQFLNTCFCLESCLLSFLELQKWLLIRVFRSCWTQWQRFDSPCNSLYLRYPTAFSKNTCFSWESVLSFIPRAPEMATSKFSEDAVHNSKDLKALVFTICWENSHHFPNMF